MCVLTTGFALLHSGHLVDVSLLCRCAHDNRMWGIVLGRIERMTATDLRAASCVINGNSGLSRFELPRFRCS
jgi:hypothetical protein